MFKDARTNFRSFGLQHPEKFNDSTQSYWLAIIGNLKSAGQLPDLNEHLKDAQGQITTCWTISRH